MMNTTPTSLHGYPEMVLIHSPYTFHAHDYILPTSPSTSYQLPPSLINNPNPESQPPPYYLKSAPSTAESATSIHSLGRDAGTTQDDTDSLGYSGSGTPTNTVSTLTPVSSSIEPLSSTTTSSNVQPQKINFPAESTSNMQLSTEDLSKVTLQTPMTNQICHLCCVTCSNEEQMGRHLNGKLHKKKLQDREFRTIVIADIPSSCELKHIHGLVCGFQLDYNTTSNAPISFNTNHSGFRDCWVVLETIEEAQRFITTFTQQKIQILGHPITISRARVELVCEVCQLKINSEHQMQQHLKGKLHATKLKNSPVPCCVEVQGLPVDITTSELLTHFQGFGITKEKIILPVVPAELFHKKGIVMRGNLRVKSSQVALRLIQEKHGMLLRGSYRIGLRLVDSYY